MEKKTKVTSKTNSTSMLGSISKDGFADAVRYTLIAISSSRVKVRPRYARYRAAGFKCDVRWKSAAYWWVATARAGQMRANTFGELDMSLRLA